MSPLEAGTSQSCMTPFWLCLCQVNPCSFLRETQTSINTIHVFIVSLGVQFTKELFLATAIQRNTSVALTCRHPGEMANWKRSLFWLILCAAVTSLAFLHYDRLRAVGANLFGFARRHQEYFQDVNKYGVYTFHNVCLEINPEPVIRTVQFIGSERSFLETLRVVVYDAANNSRDSISVSGSGNTIWNQWDVAYNRSRIPEDRVWMRDKVAFFIAFTCPGNLHHFFEDEFRILQSLVAATNRLESTVPNRLLYRIPWDLEPSEMDCYNVHRYEKLLALLNFDSFHDVYFKMPPNICFEHAVFGLADFSATKRQASEFVIGRLGIDYDRCEKDKVTIIGRRTRRILNAGELVNVTRAEGFPDVRVVVYEDLSVEDQIRTAACSTLLVGVQGAGLQWAVFMRSGSTLIEIAWPQKHWPFYFSGFVPPYNIYHRGVLARHVRLNWKTYQQKVRGGVPVAAEERHSLQRSAPKNPDLDNVWKWADVVVDAEHYRAALRSHRYANSIRRH